MILAEIPFQTIDEGDIPQTMGLSHYWASKRTLELSYKFLLLLVS